MSEKRLVLLTPDEYEDLVKQDFVPYEKLPLKGNERSSIDAQVGELLKQHSDRFGETEAVKLSCKLVNDEVVCIKR